MTIAELPKFMKVGALDLEIKCMKTHEAAAEQRYGSYSPAEAMIRIDPSLNSFRVLDTLIHETTHAIYDLYALHDSDDEERVCMVMGRAWAQIYRDNPKLTQFIKNVAAGHPIVLDEPAPG